MQHFLAIMFWTSAVFAQLGVKGGVPFNEAMRLRSQISTQTLDTSTTPFVVGPMLDIRLPLGFGIEFDALWKRYETQVGSEGLAGQSWEFPLLAKYRLGGAGFRPFVVAGITHQRLGSVLTNLRAVARLNTAEVTSEFRRGGVFGGGLEFGSGRTRVSGEFRYSRWQNTALVPSSNYVDLLIGLTF
jgi:hypothetical protein